MSIEVIIKLQYYIIFSNLIICKALRQLEIYFYLIYIFYCSVKKSYEVIQYNTIYINTITNSIVNLCL